MIPVAARASCDRFALPLFSRSPSTLSSCSSLLAVTHAHTHLCSPSSPRCFRRAPADNEDVNDVPGAKRPGRRCDSTEIVNISLFLVCFLVEIHRDTRDFISSFSFLSFSVVFLSYALLNCYISLLVQTSLTIITDYFISCVSII